MSCTKTGLIAAVLLFSGLAAGQATVQKIGINVVLETPPTADGLAELALHGQILDVIPQIKAVTLRSSAAELPAIQALPYVAAASPDTPRVPGSAVVLPPSDFADGANHWPLDAINVTDFGGGRTVDYDGEGVIVAVLDSGLVSTWRDYFPEERIDSVHARAFGGGGGEKGTVSSQPDKWENDATGHGTGVTGVILGLEYAGAEPLPAVFNGVAPKATILPLKIGSNNKGGNAWWSSGTRAIVYLTDLKLSGALGNSPVVINDSSGGPVMDAMGQAAIDYAIANGIVYVSIAHNHGAAGMTFPGAYAPVISVANAGWVDEFPPDDPSLIDWILRDVPEGDASEYFISPDSGLELPGQDLDVAAPGMFVTVPAPKGQQVDYAFVAGTSSAGPHVAGVVALMLQKNPGLTASQIEEILEGSALPLAPGCRDVTFPVIGPGDFPTFSDHDNVSLFDATVCWGADATGHGVVQADEALAAVPSP